jgi:alcohol dehydrogenase class IV
MKDFTLLFPSKVIFGNGCLEKLKDAPVRGRRGLIITGKNSAKKSGLLDRTKKILKVHGREIFVFDNVEPEVSVETVDKAAELARRYKADFFVGLGGGSAIDCAKAVAGIYKDNLSVKDYLDNSIPVRKDTGFVIAIPTTSGTGSESTKNAVLTYTSKKIKISLRGESMVPSIVVMDPQLTITMPAGVTAFTGMDALTHAVESYFSSGANEITEILSLKAMTLILENISAAYKKPANIDARYNMMLGSFTAGLAFANAGLGAVHGIGHPVGAVLKLPHGLVNAILLPHVLEFNSSAVGPELIQFKKVTGIDLIKKIKTLNRSMGIAAKFSAVQKGAPRKLEEIMARIEYAASMAYNPVKMDDAMVRAILKGAL